MRSAIGLLAATLLATAAQAQVTGVVTQTTADILLRTGATRLAGEQLGGTLNDNLNSGGSFAATSQIGDGVVTFQNGNATSGGFAYVTTRTSVDITYANDTGAALIPSLRSTIVPAGFGFYSSFGCGFGLITGCSEASTATQNLFTYARNAEAPPGLDVAGASFVFQVLSDGEAIYELSGSITLMFDPAGLTNFLITDFADAASVLSGFTMVTPPGSASAVGYAWDATPLLLQIPGGLLEPGDSRTLSYVTSASSYTRANPVGGYGAVAYSAFGDPVGRGGGVQNIGFLEIDFEPPVFEDGELRFIITPVPEPATWALLVLGFGLSGAILRRRRLVASDV